MEETKKEPPSSGTTIVSKRRREDKQRRRDHRAVENIMKEFVNMDDSEKLRMLVKKYSDLYDEFRALQNNAALSDKRLTILQRERDQLQTEQGKLVLAKARMESLCRELQKQNKLIKEENLAKIREEEERRKEVALKFQNTLSEVSSMVQENSEKNIKLRDDNKDMANKIQALCEQFDKRKEQLVRVEKQLELERQLSEATIAKAELELKAERELWNKEREILQGNLKKSEENCQKLQENIKCLEENLQMYSGKYKEFESTITRSNEVFDNCKSEMYKMTKQIATLEKECKIFKQRWQKNAQCVIELTSTKQTQDNKIDALERKVEQLQKLCRQLQTDRSAYIKLLKANGIEPVSQKCIDEPVASPRKTKKEIELQHLKNNLRALQEHFYSMQAKSSTTSPINDDDGKSSTSCDCELSSNNLVNINDIETTVLQAKDRSEVDAETDQLEDNHSIVCDQSEADAETVQLEDNQSIICDQSEVDAETVQLEDNQSIICDQSEVGAETVKEDNQSIICDETSAYIVNPTIITYNEENDNNSAINMNITEKAVISTSLSDDLQTESIHTEEANTTDFPVSPSESDCSEIKTNRSQNNCESIENEKERPKNETNCDIKSEPEEKQFNEMISAAT